MSSHGNKKFITKDVVIMERIITMSIQELSRAKLKQKTLTQIQSASILSISTRQIRRLFSGHIRNWEPKAASSTLSRLDFFTAFPSSEGLSRNS